LHRVFSQRDGRFTPRVVSPSSASAWREPNVRSAAPGSAFLHRL